MDNKKFISFENLAQYHETVKAAIKNQVKYSDFVDKGVARKTVQLNNFDSISGIGTNCVEGSANGYVGGEDLTGKGFNLVMLSKWNVADFGSTGVQANINTKGKRVLADGTEVPAVYANDDFTLATTQELDSLKESLSQGVIDQVANLLKDAPEDFDTLKEIADWIGNDESGHVKEAADMATAISANTEAIGTPAKAAVGVEGEEGYVPAEAATGLYAAIEEAACRCAECSEEEIASLVFVD